MGKDSGLSWFFIILGLGLIGLGVYTAKNPGSLTQQHGRRYVRLSLPGILYFIVATIISTIIECFPPQWQRIVAWIVGTCYVALGVVIGSMGLMGPEKAIAMVIPSVVGAEAHRQQDGWGDSAPPSGIAQVKPAAAQTPPPATPTPDDSTPTPIPTPTVDPRIAEIDRLLSKAGKQWEAGKRDVSLMLAEEALKDAEANLPAGHPKIDEVRKQVEAARQAAKQP